MANLACEIVTPDNRIFTGRATQVIVPSVDGTCGILPGHEMFACRMKNGKVIVHTGEGADDITEYATYMGFTEVSADRVLVLARQAVEVSDIDVDAVKKTRAELEEKLNAMPAEAVSKQKERVAKVQRDSIQDDIEWCDTQLEVAQAS